MEASRVTDRFLLQPPSLPSLNFSPKQRHASATASSSLSPLFAYIIVGSIFSVVASVTLLLFLRRRRRCWLYQLFTYLFQLWRASEHIEVLLSSFSGWYVLFAAVAIGAVVFTGFRCNIAATTTTTTTMLVMVIRTIRSSPTSQTEQPGSQLNGF